MDTSRLCRSCMKEVAPWELATFDEGTLLMFTYCTNIQVPENDLLPKQFCYDCTIKVKSSYTYIKEAQRTNETLTNLLTQRTVIVEPIRPVSPLPNNEDSVFENKPDMTDNVTVPNAESIIRPVKEYKEADQKHVCTVCKKVFLSKVWFEKHMKNQHNGKVYSCSECPKTFQRQSQLTVHAITHSAERRFACECGKRYKRRKELTVHARTHKEARPYQCDHCHMSFKLKSVLRSHLVVHQPDKPHLCYICGWRFKQAGNLSVHMRAHGGARPCACACGYRAPCASALRRHELRHAPRALRCAKCAKRFHDQSALTRHIRSHTGARPYQCPACPRAFADSWKRKLHMMRAHRVPLPRIPRMRADPRAAWPAHCPPCEVTTTIADDGAAFMTHGD